MLIALQAHLKSYLFVRPQSLSMPFDFNVPVGAPYTGLGLPSLGELTSGSPLTSVKLPSETVLAHTSPIKLDTKLKKKDPLEIKATVGSSNLHS